MALVKPSLSGRSCFVWETKLPSLDRPRYSPVFSVMNSLWLLEMTLAKDAEWCYFISIVNKSGLKTMSPFRVTTYIEDGRNESRPISLDTRTISLPTYRYLWYIAVRAIAEHIPDYVNYGNITVVCLFYDTLPIEKITEHKSIQVSLDPPLPPESVSLEKTVLSKSSSSSSLASLESLDPSLNLESLSQDLGNLLHKNVMPDVQLKCGDLIIHAHRALLAARSEVFSAMLQHEMVESSTGVIDIKDIEPTVLDIFLKYLYTGKVPDALSEDMATKLYVAGDKYAVSALTKTCSDFITKNLSEQNFLTFLKLAHNHSNNELKEAVTRFVTKRCALLKSENWIDFSEEHPTLANHIYQKYISTTL